MTVSVKRYSSLPEIDEREALGYAGVKTRDAQSLELLKKCGELLEISPKVCYIKVPLRVEGSFCRLGDIGVSSELLAKRLEGCCEALIFCATVGVEADRLIAKHSRLSPSLSVMLSALATERTEAVCDLFCSDYSEKNGIKAKPRFSPGYGDLPLEFQRDIFRLLDPSRHIGVSLGERLLMSPSKSVTAIVGIL